MLWLYSLYGDTGSREPREGQQAPYLLGIFFSQICGKDFMICANWSRRRQKRRTSSSWHRSISIFWEMRYFNGRLWATPKRDEIEAQQSKGAACTELQKSPLRKWHTILRRSPLNFKALNFYVQTNFSGLWLKIIQKDLTTILNGTFSTFFFKQCCKVR